ncbi:somatostatin receptor type 5-like [Ptychodera flava]|uniref:somatostatin receptor type 5-like n=1 Tax=Ptychodera flava TaxID=63121 RepID=UPI00396A47BC
MNTSDISMAASNSSRALNDTEIFTNGTTVLPATVATTAMDPLLTNASEIATSVFSTVSDYVQGSTDLGVVNTTAYNINDSLVGFNATTVEPPSVSGNDGLLTAEQTLILNAVTGSIGVLGNLLVCFVFIRVKGLRTLTNFFIVNQSIIDLLTSIAFLANKCGPKNIWVPPGFWGELLCKLWLSGYLMWSLIMTSSVNLTVMTLERYVAMVHPLKHKYSYTWRKARLIAAFVWIFPFAAELFWAFANHNGDNGRCYIQWYSDVASKVSGVLFFCIEWVFPVTAISLTYISILVLLSRRSKSKLSEDMAGTTQGNRSQELMERARRNVTKTLFIVALAYLICWTLQAWEYFLYSVVELIPLFSVFHDFAVILAFTNMCVNPFIYALQYEPFRNGILEAFCCKKKKRDRYLHDTSTKTGIENIAMTTSTENA